VLTSVGPTSPAPAGSTPYFEFTIENPAFSDALNVRLDLTFGSGLRRGSVQCVGSAGGVCPADLDSTSVATLRGYGGKLRFTVSAYVEAGSTGTIPLTAAVSATNDDVLTNNTAAFNVAVYSADVSVATATSAIDVAGGASVPFSIVVANAGPDAALNVTLDSVLGGHQSLQSTTCTSTGGATCPDSFAPTMTIPSLPKDGSLTFSLTTQLAMDALASVSASMRAQLAGDLAYANNAAAVSAYVRVPTASTSPTFAKMQSDVGDTIGGGIDHSYTRVNSVFVLQQYDESLGLEITGTESWRMSFYKPGNLARWQPGLYVNTSGNASTYSALGGMSISGPAGIGCGASGWIKVTAVGYTGDEVTSFDALFAEHCSDNARGVRGQLHWVANDGSRPPGPVNPPPAGLWRPAAGSMPSSGNYVYVESDAGDPIMQGATEIYTQTNSLLTVSEQNGSLGANVIGAKNFSGGLRAMAPITEVEPGYYAIDAALPAWNPANPAMSFNGDGHSCSQVIGGWFVVDSIARNNGLLTAVDARFEQHCGNQVAALRGQIHWRSDDQSTVPGPVNPPPADLWSPPAGAVPATGNVVYLHNDPEVGAPEGFTYTYTPLNSVLQVPGSQGPVGNRFLISVNGDETWNGEFQAMSSVTDLRAGYYGNLGNFNPLVGGLSWYRQNGNCPNPRGWFVVDSINFNGGLMDSIVLRFEQYCGTNSAPLHGYIRWSAADTRSPTPPQNPPPANLWQPAAGATPASGNYVYLLPDEAGVPGQAQTYTQANAEIIATSFSSGVEFDVRGDQYWDGDFSPMPPFAKLQPGYYDLPNGTSAARGGFGWNGFHESCGISTGWFAVDAVTYEAGIVRTFDARFERHCTTAPGTLHGKVHWRFDDPTAAPGPVTPPPAGLWRPPVGVVPASGNVFYVIGEPTEFVTGGIAYLYTPANSTITAGSGFGNATVDAQEPGTVNDWFVEFDPMNSIPRLQPGYYANTSSQALGNPTRGRMDVGGNFRGCQGFAVGWFVIDSITYVGEQMTSITARFESRCGAGAPALHGMVRWTQ